MNADELRLQKLAQQALKTESDLERRLAVSLILAEALAGVRARDRRLHLVPTSSPPETKP